MPADVFSIKKVYQALPLELIRALAKEALEQGQPKDQVISDIVDIVDAEVDWAKIFPKAPKIVVDNVERYDAPIVKALVAFIVNAIEISRSKR